MGHGACRAERHRGFPAARRRRCGVAGAFRDTAPRRVARRRLAAEDALLLGKVQPHPLPTDVEQALARAFAAHPAIAQAWAFNVPIEGDLGGGSVLGLVLRLDPVRLHALELDDDQVLDAVEGLLRWLCPANLEWQALLRYTSEGLPPDLQAKTAGTRAIKG